MKSNMTGTPAEAIAHGMQQSIEIWANEALAGAVPNFRLTSESGTVLTVAWFVYRGEQSELPNVLRHLAGTCEGGHFEYAKGRCDA